MSVQLTKKEFEALFPDEDTCLIMIFEKRYNGWNVCPDCLKKSKFHKVTNRKCFACQGCGFQVHPLAGTIYHKSSTPLRTWFYAIYLFAKDERITAKELQRQTNVTYKTARRMLALISQLHKQTDETPSTLVEITVDHIYDFISKLRNKGRII